ncbi:Uncharacterized protein SCF082_LOCUS25294 [Durusdinium trenchii]|uniref:DUF4116 domain-containing protein n=1 Tax=Durusdinium trenchii TaxID=1381693 RepID=A0ABP0M0I7_9DINO
MINRGAFHRKVVLDVVTQYGDLLCYAQPKLQRDREVVLAAVANSSWAVKYVAEELLNDDNFALEMIRANAMTLRMLPERCRHDKDLVLAAVSGDGRCLALSALQDDVDFAREAVCCSAEALQFVPQELKADFSLVLDAVSADGRALRFASSHLRSERCVALAAVRSRAEAMAFAGQELLADRSFVLEALKLQGAALEHVPHFQEDEDLVLAAVASDCSALRFSALRCQRSFVMRAVAAVGSSGLALQFVPESLKSDEEVVWCAVSQDPGALFFAPSFQSDQAFLLRCAHCGALEFADPGGDWAKETPCGSPWQDVFAFRHLSEELRNDREVLLHAAALGEWDFEGDKDFQEEARRLRSASAMVRRHPTSRCGKTCDCFHGCSSLNGL